MTTYKSNLLDRLEGMSDAVKWSLVGVVVIAAILVAVFGVRSADQAVRLAYTGETEAPQQEAPAQPESVEAKPVSQPESKPEAQPQPRQRAATRPAQQRKPAPQPEDNTRFVSEIDGYVINGIMLLEGAPPEVLLKKGGDISSYRVGDTVAGYKVESIHRHHIMLVRGDVHVHLNRMQF